MTWDTTTASLNSEQSILSETMLSQTDRSSTASSKLSSRMKQGSSGLMRVPSTVET
jgi:hypothetical protein